MIFAGLHRWWRRRLAPIALPDILSASVRTLSHRFTAQRIDHAVIGGIAISLHGPPRATQDVDFLIDGAAADRAHATMTELGFETLQRTKIFANYLLAPLRVDFLHTLVLFEEEHELDAILEDLRRRRG